MITLLQFHYRVASVGLVAKRLDAPVGRHFLIAVPYSCYLTKSFISLSIHKRGTGRIYSQSRGCGQGKIFLGLRPRPPSSFAPPIKYPGGATGNASFSSLTASV